MEKDKGSTLKSIMEYSKSDQSTNPYEEYRKSSVDKIYHRLTSTILPHRFKQALIISGIILMLVVSIISIITVVFAESLTSEGTYLCTCSTYVHLNVTHYLGKKK